MNFWHLFNSTKVWVGVGNNNNSDPDPLFCGAVALLHQFGGPSERGERIMHALFEKRLNPLLRKLAIHSESSSVIIEIPE